MSFSSGIVTGSTSALCPLELGLQYKSFGITPLIDFWLIWGGCRLGYRTMSASERETLVFRQVTKALVRILIDYA